MPPASSAVKSWTWTAGSCAIERMPSGFFAGLLKIPWFAHISRAPPNVEDPGRSWRCGGRRSGPQGPSFGSESPGPLRGPSSLAPFATGFSAIPRSEQPRLRNGPKDRRLDQNHRGRCAAHRSLRSSLQGSWRYANSCRSQSAPGDAGRRTAVWIRTAGAAAQPIASLRPLATGFSAIPRSEQPRLRNGPKDRRSDQNHRGRCAAHRSLRSSLQGSWRYANPCGSRGAPGDAGRRTVVWIRTAGAAARPIAACAARYRVRGVTQILVGARVHLAMRAAGPSFGSGSPGPLRSPSRGYARSLQGSGTALSQAPIGGPSAFSRVQYPLRFSRGCRRWSYSRVLS